MSVIGEKGRIGVSVRPAGVSTVRPLMAPATSTHILTRTVEFGEAVKWLLLIAGCGAAIYLPVYFTGHPYPAKSFVPNLLGMIGGGMMLSGALFYAVRKRVRVLKNAGQMKDWLNVHILLCSFGPLLVIYHSALSVKALNSGVALYSMLVVVGSGVVGRYIYRHFQLTLSGERASLKEMQTEADELIRNITARFPDAQQMIATITEFFSPQKMHKAGGLVRSLILVIRLDWIERTLRRQLDQRLRRAGRTPDVPQAQDRHFAEESLVRLISLEKNISALEATTRLFAYWHKLHVPMIWILVVTVIVHMAAVLLL
jgi:hypothetical protein